MFEFQDVLKELGPTRFESRDIWLFNAVSYRNVTVTNGSYNGYGDYCGLDYYYEEISTLTAQDEGVKGVFSIDTIITLTKSENSLALYNEFVANNIFKSMQVLQIVKVGNDLKIKQDIKFASCKINLFKIFMDKITLTFSYNSREEKFNVLDHSGAYKGCSVSVR